MKRVKINDDGFVRHVRTEAEAKQLFGEQTCMPCMMMAPKQRLRMKKNLKRCSAVEFTLERKLGS